MYSRIHLSLATLAVILLATVTTAQQLPESAGGISAALTLQDPLTTETRGGSTTYSDEAVFIAVASSNCTSVSLESFEGLAATNGSSQSMILTPDFSVTTANPPQLGIWDIPNVGAFATDGVQWMGIDEFSGLPMEVTLTFNAPVDHFGINFTDYGDFGSGDLSFENDAGDSFTAAVSGNPDGNLQFFGIHNSVASFSTVTFDHMIDGEFFGVDEIYYCLSNQGSLFFSEDNNANGLYTLDTTTGAANNVGISGVRGSTVGLAPSGSANLLYGSKWLTLLHIQSDGSGAADVGGVGSEGLAFDAGTGTLYAAINGTFFTVDPADGTLLTTLDAPPGDVEGLAYGNGGVYGLIGFDGSDTELFFYDSSSGWSVVGDTGIDWNLVGLAYDPQANLLYAKGSQDSFLYRIDPATAATTVVGDTGLFNGGGLAFVHEIGLSSIFQDGFESGDTSSWSNTVP